MPFKSKFPDLDIPETNILNIVFPKNDPIDPNTPIWSDSDDPKNHITKNQALHSIKKFSIALDHLNVKPQQTVMIFTPNHINVPIVYMGIVGSRRIFSGANPVYTQSEVEYQLRDTDARLLLVHPSLLDTGLAAAQKVGIPRNRIFQFSDLPAAESKGIADWNDILGSDEEAGKYEWPALSGSEARKTIASINYSSGTTGLPKGVMVSHYNVIANVMQTIYMRDLEMPYDPARRPEERWLAFLPLYHAYGQLWTCLIAPRLGIDVYVMKKFDFLGFLEGVQKYRVTHLQVAPPVVVMLGRRPGTRRYDLSSVKYILCGAAPLAKDLQNEVCDLLKVSITQGWGMTETTSAAIHVPGGANDDSGSVGMLDPNTEAKLVDDDGREVVGIGEPGELYVRGPQMCMGYWRNETATKETLDSDGWLRTGDVAKVNSKEWFWIVDRKKELIKVNGLQVAPAELEAVLLGHEAVADAAVVGITIRGEEWPRGYVVLQPGFQGKVNASDIHEWIKSRIAKHKHLVGGIAFVDELPKLASGKIIRKVMREWARNAIPEVEKTVKARL